MPKIKASKNMNLGMILNAPYPADIRVKKEADALIKAGFKVHLLCLRKKHEPYEEYVQHLKVTRIDAGTTNYALAFWDAIMAVSFKHPAFMRSIPDWVRNNSITVLHVHDLPLAGTALALRAKLPLSVVLDLHENYPEALRTWFEWKRGLIVKLKNKIFMNADRWQKHEHKALAESDYVIAVVQEMKNRLIQVHAVPPEKITIVSNTEDKTFAESEVIPSVYPGLEKKFKVVYSGGIGPHRGVDTAIHGMSYLQEYPDIELIIVGSGSHDVVEHLRQTACNSGMSDRIHFLGHQPFHKFYSYMHLADINIIPHKSNDHTDNTIPHKLFQSMMSGKPLLVSSSQPLKRVVENTGAGLVFHANDPRDFATQVLRLYQDKTLCDRLGRNGTKATLEGPLNWDTEQQTLVDFYIRVFQKK